MRGGEPTHTPTRDPWPALTPHLARTLEVVCVNEARVDTFARQESNSFHRL